MRYLILTDIHVTSRLLMCLAAPSRPISWGAWFRAWRASKVELMSDFGRCLTAHGFDGVVSRRSPLGAGQWIFSKGGK